MRPTPAAWRVGLIGLGLLGAAFNTGNNLIYLTFSLLVAAALVSAAVAPLAGRRAGFDLRLPSSPTVGAPFTFDLHMTNRGRRGAIRAVDVELLTDQGRFGPVFVERLAPGESVRIGLPARGGRRGRLRVLGIALRSSYPFGLLEQRETLPRAAELTVLPRAARAAGRPTPRIEAGGAALSPRSPGTEYRGLRRGGDDDDLRSVDWKVTARRGVVIVRETVGEGRAELRLEIATRVPGDPVAARGRFERDVERLAGAARQALRDGGVVHLAVDSATRASYAGEKDLPRLRARLAALEPTGSDGRPLPAAALAGRMARPREDTAAVRGSALGRNHRFSVLAALAVGLLASVAFEAIGPVGFALCALGTVATALAPRAIARATSVAGRLWRLAALASLVLFLADLIWGRHDLLAGSSDLLVFVTLLALFNARSVEDDRRLLLISFVHVLLAASLTTELAFALPLAAWLLLAVHASIAWVALPAAAGAARVGSILDPGARRVRYVRPATALVPAIVVAAAVVFLVVPHFGTGTFRPTTLRRQHVSGFSDSASLGDITRIKLDTAKVMEIEVDGARAGDDELRWRGVSLSRFDGRNWTRATPRIDGVRRDAAGALVPAAGAGPPTRPLTQRIRLEPTDAGMLFAAARARTIVSDDFDRLGQDATGNLQFLRTPGRRLSYTVVSDLPARDPAVLRGAAGDETGEVSPLDLELPPLDARIPALAREITAGAATRYDAVRAIESWLPERFRYSLAVNDAGVDDPLARFLFDGAPGHCEYFATAMVVLARSQGIPARFVAGYLRGEKSRFGRRYLVRQSDAHSWVEVHFPGAGWVPFDPTPPAGRVARDAPGLADLASFLYSSATRLWDDYVVGVDLDDQGRRVLALFDAGRALVAGLAAWSWLVWAGVLAACGAAIALLAGWRGARRRRARVRREFEATRAVPGFYLQLLELLRARGLTRRPAETAAELQARAGALLGPRGGERLRELTRLYHRVRFDGATAEHSVGRIARALLDDVREELERNAAAAAHA